MQNFASCSQLWRCRRACLARRRNVGGATAAGGWSTGAARLADCSLAALGLDSDCLVHRQLALVDDDGGDGPIGANDDVLEPADIAIAVPDAAAAQRRELDGALAGEGELG